MTFAPVSLRNKTVPRPQPLATPAARDELIKAEVWSRHPAYARACRLMGCDEAWALRELSDSTLQHAEVALGGSMRLTAARELLTNDEFMSEARPTTLYRIAKFIDGQLPVAATVKSTADFVGEFIMQRAVKKLRHKHLNIVLEKDLFSEPVTEPKVTLSA